MKDDHIACSAGRDNRGSSGGEEKKDETKWAMV